MAQSNDEWILTYDLAESADASVADEFREALREAGWRHVEKSVWTAQVKDDPRPSWIGAQFNKSLFSRLHLARTQEVLDYREHLYQVASRPVTRRKPLSEIAVKIGADKALRFLFPRTDWDSFPKK